MATGDKLVTLDDLKAAYDDLKRRVNGLRSNCYVKTVNAGSAVLSGMKYNNNPTPSVSNMQKLLEINGSGRLLVLAAYGNALNQNKVEHYASTSSTTAEMREKGYARVRIAADSRIIHKACLMVAPTTANSGGGAGATFAALPPLIASIDFWDPMTGSGSGGYASLTRTLQLVMENGRHSFPANLVNISRGKWNLNIDGPNSDPPETNRFSTNYPVLYYLHEPEDDNRTGVLDYECSLFRNGLYFDNNLTIHAAYGIAPTQYSPNGIVAVYELFDD